MRSVISKIALMAALFFCLAPASAAADEAAFGEGGGVRELRSDWKLDLAVTAIAGAGWLIMSGGKEAMGPKSCRWCEVNSFDAWGHDNLKWSNPNAANVSVYVTGYALAPAAAFGLDALAAHREGAIDGFWIDALVIAEAAALSCMTTEIVKMAVGRQRPRAHYGRGSLNVDDNHSFPSGHTGLAFSLAAASGTVASMRNYSLAPVIWGTGMGIAALTGYLSVAADRHYLTDVIGGAVLGSAFGVAIPYLFHRPREGKPPRASFSFAPVEGGGLASLSGTW
ncbi:MAG TPA: phosphatase PAP2 family protein [bacterium]|nr:phosphatase PAP2 family protein [bacterium]